MKRFFASLLSLSLLLASCTFSSPKTSATPTSQFDPFQIPWDDRSIFQSGLIKSALPVLNELPGASVYHIDLNIAEDMYHVMGREDVQYTNNESVSLNEVQFRLFPNILGGETKTTNLQVDGQSITPQYQLRNSLMIVPLSKALEPGQSIVFTMDFAVTVPQEVELNYGVLAYYEDVLALAHAYPMICVYDDEGWNAELPSQNGDLTYADASFYIVRVTAPKDLKLVTSGQRVDFAEAGQVQTMIVASGPARDFVLMASPQYEEVSRKFGEVTINTYAVKDSMKGAEFALEVASKAIDVFSKRYAPYPYTELDLAATPNLALGIEYPGAIALTTRIYDISGQLNGNQISDIVEATVAHEVGHQFFYNLVGNDQLDDPWLDEALAQFATVQYYTDTYGEQAAEGFHSSLEQRWARVDFQKIPIGLPVVAYQGREYGAIVYGRGPLFMEALRDEMGVPAFDDFMQDYTKSLAWKISTPETLQDLAERHCACDLDELFDEWVYQ